MKTNARALFPFQLLLRDPSEHMQNVQENKKFAEDTSASLTPNDDIDRRYTIKVPKADNYFPLIRYKCSSELKPVPIVSFVGAVGVWCALIVYMRETYSSFLLVLWYWILDK